jgi:UDPglucose 6-dehydrogenase
MGAKVRAYDPAGMEQAKTMVGNVAFCQDAYDCAKGASALVIVTEWEQFRALDFVRLRSVMEMTLLVDLRNIYRADDVARAGFAYESIGRGKK